MAVQRNNQERLSHTTTTEITTTEITTTTTSTEMDQRVDGIGGGAMVPQRTLKRTVSIDNTAKAERLMAIRRDHFRRHSSLDPTEVLISILRVKRIHVSTHSYKDLTDFFQKPVTQEPAHQQQHQEPSFTPHEYSIISAVRNGDVDSLRKLWCQESAGHRLQCFNKARESILHVACRRGQTEIVRFLVQEAGVSVRVCDDYGRNPMHDACWTPEPNFEVMEILLAKCPDLLLIQDMRGHTPLRYAPKQHWKTWVKYLAKSFPKIIPRDLPFGDDGEVC